MFMGEYRHSIDDKGRIIIPSRFRDELGADFVITRGLDNCLFAYPMNEWKALEQKLKSLPFTKADARSFTRFFFSGASECELDKQGRVNIPNHLLQFADIQKECVIIGVSNRVEIWSEQAWDGYFENSKGSFEEISEKLVDFDI